MMLHFPTNLTGGTTDRAEPKAVVELARRLDQLAITDPIYSELTFEGEHVSIAALPGVQEQTIFLHGFSNAYAMTGFRIGYACGPAELVEAMMKIHQYSMLCVTITSQEPVLKALLHSDPDIAAMQKSLSAAAQLHLGSLPPHGPRLPTGRGARFYTVPLHPRRGPVGAKGCPPKGRGRSTRRAASGRRSNRSNRSPTNGNLSFRPARQQRRHIGEPIP